MAEAFDADGFPDDVWTLILGYVSFPQVPLALLSTSKQTASLMTPRIRDWLQEHCQPVVFWYCFSTQEYNPCKANGHYVNRIVRDLFDYISLNTFDMDRVLAEFRVLLTAPQTLYTLSEVMFIWCAAQQHGTGLLFRHYQKATPVLKRFRACFQSELNG